MDHLPLFADLKGKRCLVVGGGSVAARKIRLLLRANASVTVVSPVVGDEVSAFDPQRVEIINAPFSTPVCSGMALIIAATSDGAVNRDVAATAAELGIWCNVVDNLELSTFIVPAIVDRSPVVVAISTGGAAPVLARRIKSQIEAILPMRIGQLASRARQWRDVVKRRLPGMLDRLRFWERFFDGPIARHVLGGRIERAEAAFATALTAPAARFAHGEAYLVGAGPGDPGLMTMRGRQLLGQADIVLYDALVSDEILDFARKDATLIPVGKKPGDSDKQPYITERMISLVKQGRRVCRLKGGDPFVFGRGGEEAAALAAARLPFEVVPGISAALGCAASAGIPLTQRGVSNSVTLATPIVDLSEEPDWALLARSGHTLALYMSVRKIDEVTAALIANGMDPATPAAIVENGTRHDERIVEADLAHIARTSEAYRVRSPAILFVGESVALRARLGRFDSRHAPAADGSAHLHDEWPASAARTSTNYAGGSTTAFNLGHTARTHRFLERSAGPGGGESSDLRQHS